MLMRCAAEADVPAIAGIYRPEVADGTATFELDPPDDAEMLRRFRATTGAGFPYLVAEVDGRVAAYAYAGPFRPRPAFRFTVEDSIYVARAAQGRGIGLALLKRLIDETATLGYRQMVAVIGDSANQAASLALHRAAGFAVVGQLPSVGHKHGRWLDTVYMQRALGCGDGMPPRTGL